MMRKLLNLKISFYIYLIALFSLAVQATDFDIALLDTGHTYKFVKNNGKVYTEDMEAFLEATDIHNNTVKWDTLKNKLKTKKNKGLVGEIAAKSYFKQAGYQILEEHYNDRLSKLIADTANNNVFQNLACTTKKGPDNGIDGIFILNTDSFDDPSHIIINEAKFRNKKTLSINDFGVVKKNNEKVRQSHSIWNKDRFADVSCFSNLNYDSIPIIRTATILNQDGLLKLYEIKDVNGQYPSEWDENTEGGKAFNIFSKNINK